MNNQEEPKFIDAESYVGGEKEKLTFRQIVLNQLSRLTTKMTVEWTGGYWNTRERAMGGTFTTDRYYVPDTREEFINGVNCLHDILISYFDKKMNKDAEDFKKEVQEFNEEIYPKVEKEELTKDQYKNRKAELYRILFRALNKLLKRLDYLKGKVFEEEA